MVLHRHPFKCCRGNRILLEIAWYLFFPFYYSINRQVRLFHPTTKELRKLSKGKRVCSILICFPFWLLVFLIAIVPALVALLLWFPLQFCRRNYRYSSSSSSSSWSLRTISFPFSLTIAQANVCLLPEFATRANNLNAPTWRVDEIGRRLLNLTEEKEEEEEGDKEEDLEKGTKDKIGLRVAHRENGDPEETKSLVNRKRQKTSTASDGLLTWSYQSNDSNDANSHVVEAFPEKIDFLCLCEVFDRDAAKTIVQILHRHFDHIIYDISQRPALNIFKACNSGLLFASKYPIVDVVFQKYNATEGSDSLAMKGVLLIKMRLGIDAEGKQLTGFVTHTHLQAKLSTRSCNVQMHQLDWVESKMNEFQSSHRLSPSEELVCFNMLTGDLNFDCTSADESQLAQHSLFHKFKDPCRDDKKKEKKWTVGTELNQLTLYDPRVSTPEGLKEVLSSTDEIRKDFVVSTNGSVVGEGDKNGRRRIDYICLAEDVDVKIDVNDEDFQFVTALATLTDHLPMAMTFTLSQ